LLHLYFFTVFKKHRIRTAGFHIEWYLINL
jgi:hypothetical protein